ncbi:unnamed protein product [Closterium sp. Yama58-4]|nr:unnamed protein product [Closterium sp. Yama58-4]
MEELAACKEWQKIQDMKMNIELEIKLKQSEGDRRKALEAITTASQTTLLNLRDLKCLSNDILRLVSTMSHLKSIDLTATAGFGAEGVKHLYRLPRLEVLGLENTGVSDNALEGIGSLTSLKLLDLEATKVTNAGLQHLTALSSLRLLWLSECKGVTDAGMMHVRRLTGLEELALDGTAVTDYGVQLLTPLTKLITLLPPKGFWIENDGMEVRRRIVGLQDWMMMGRDMW